MKVVRDSVVVSILNGISQFGRFLLFIVIAALFGATWKTDAFLLAQTIPALFINSTIGSLLSVLIPVMTEYKMRSPDQFGKLVGSAIVYSGMFSIFVSLILVIGLPFILRWLTPELTVAARELVFTYTLILLPIIFLQFSNGVMTAVYCTAGRFWSPAAAEAARSFLTIFLIILLKPFLEINSLPVSVVAGVLIQSLVLLVLWRKNFVRIKLNLFREDVLLHSLKLAFPLMIGMGAMQMGVVVSRFLAATLSEGSLTILDYASRISSGIMELLTSGIMLVSLADWSNVVINGGKHQLQEKLRHSIITTLFIIMPLIAIIIAMRYQVTQLILLRGEYKPAMVLITADLMALLLISIPFDIIGRFYVRILLVLKETMIIGGLAINRFILTIFMSILLLFLIGINGLAIAESVAAVLTTIGLVYATHKRQEIRISGVWRRILKFSLLAVLCGFVSLGISRIFTTNLIILDLSIFGFIGGLAYIFVSIFVERDQIEYLFNAFFRARQRQ